MGVCSVSVERLSRLCHFEMRRGKIRPWGVVTPSHKVRSSFSAGRLSRMSKALPKGGSALSLCRVTNARLWPGSSELGWSKA